VGGPAGRAAIWADTGLGKTLMQLEWARLSGDRVLIVAPLAVCAQTVARGGQGRHRPPRYLRKDDAPGMGVVTNYEMTPRFDPRPRRRRARRVLDPQGRHEQDARPADRLSGRAAPARVHRDAGAERRAELANHAEFLGVATRREMLSTYFVHDQDGWRPKGHARGRCTRGWPRGRRPMRRPSDLGYPDDGYVLPGLDIVPHLVDVDVEPRRGRCSPPSLGGVGGPGEGPPGPLSARCEVVAALVDAEPDEPWVLWCGLNDEADLLAALIPGAVNVQGSDHPQEKADAMLDFADGGTIRADHEAVDRRVRAELAALRAHGVRGLSDSYETYYQAIRRCYRYGQTRRVAAHIVLSRLEAEIAANVRARRRPAARFTGELVGAMRAAGAWRATA
jgi:hypothetical protein